LIRFDVKVWKLNLCFWKDAQGSSMGKISSCRLKCHPTTWHSCLFIFLVIVIFSLTMMKSYIWHLSWTVISVHHKVWVLYDLIKYAHNGSYSFFFPNFFDCLANQTLLNLNIYLVESRIVHCFAKSFIWVK
jgi:hypothetical protein